MGRVGLALGLVLISASPGYAQADGGPADDQPFTPTVVTHAKRGAHAKGEPASPPLSDAERAARLAEGKRKFFEQEQGFETNSPPPSPITSVFPKDANGFPNDIQLPLRKR